MYTFNWQGEEFICELFEETMSILTWKDHCNNGKYDEKHGKMGKEGRQRGQNDSSCWNAYY